MNSSYLNYTSDIHFDFSFFSTTGVARIFSLTETGIEYYNYDTGYPVRMWYMSGTMN